MKTISIICLQAFLLGACSSDSIKHNINKAGDVAGQTAGEFIEGASKGIQKAFDVQLVVPDHLKDKGIEFGKATVSNDSVGTDNLLLLYVVFHKDFKGRLMTRVFDEQNLEMGRSVVQTEGRADEAKFVEFHFDKRTNIDSKNKLTIE